MQTICRDDNNVSLYLFDDETIIVQYEDRIEIGDPVEIIIADCNENNVTLYTDVTPPEDWEAWKYTFDGNVWALFDQENQGGQ